MSAHDERFSAGPGPRTWRGIVAHICLVTVVVAGIKMLNPYNTPAWTVGYGALMLAAAIVGAWRVYRNWQIEQQSDP
jgi:hypothetical protein